MESFIESYITSTDATLVNDEILLERRISPYATLRPGDLAGLLKLHSALPFPGTGGYKSSCSHGNLRFHQNQHQQKVEAILEKELGQSSGDEDVLDDEDDEIVTECHGADGNHVPAVYSVKGVKSHEMPVVGVYVDKRICPGFRYRVRRADTSGRYFFDGEARLLQSVGMGYGQRLTFQGPTLNNNECYFWSDSDPNGFAFSIQAVDEGQKFFILDSSETVVGEAVIDKIHEPQEEIDMNTDKSGVTKTVRVALTCSVKYYHRHHYGLMELMAHESQETITGEAILVKGRRDRQASLKSVNNVFLQRFGRCSFIPDSY